MLMQDMKQLVRHERTHAKRNARNKEQINVIQDSLGKFRFQEQMHDHDFNIVRSWEDKPTT